MNDGCASTEEIGELYNFGKQYGCAQISPTGLCMDSEGYYTPNSVNDQLAEEELRGWKYFFTGVTIVYFGPVAIEEGLWWLQKQVWKAGWGLHDAIGIPLAKWLANKFTQNPSADIVSIGNNPAYQQSGYTYFKVPNCFWKVFPETVNGANDQFMFMQVDQAKDFGVIITSKVGLGTEREIELILASGNYTEIETLLADFTTYFQNHSGH